MEFDVADPNSLFYDMAFTGDSMWPIFNYPDLTVEANQLYPPTLIPAADPTGSESVRATGVDDRGW